MDFTCPKCEREGSTHHGLMMHLEHCMGTKQVFTGVSMWENSRKQQVFTKSDGENYESESFIATEDAWDNENRAYVCPMCSTEFRHLNALQAHYDCGTHDEERPYECKVCNRTLKRISFLRQHQEDSNCKEHERLSSLLVANFQHSVQTNRLKMIRNGEQWSKYPEATLYFDGGARNNPGRAAAGFVLYDHRDQIIAKQAIHIPLEATSNQAEYIGLISGLRYIKKEKLGIRDLKIYGDSNVVINQCKGEFNVKSSSLQPLYETVMPLLQQQFLRFMFVWIPREENEVADELVKQVLYDRHRGEEECDEVADWFPPLMNRYR